MKNAGGATSLLFRSTSTRVPIRIVSTLMGGAIIGKVLGFVREILMARIFGATMITDVFRAAITAVQLPLLPMTSETTPAVLIPMHRAWQVEGRAPAMLAALCLTLGTGGILAMLLVQISGPLWVRLLVGGFTEETQGTVLEFVRIMALWMPGAVVVECLAAAEIALGRSRIAALRSVILNISIICGILIFVESGALALVPTLFALSFNVLAAWGCWLLAREGALNPSGLNIREVKEAALDFCRRLRPFVSLPIFQQGNCWVERLVASAMAVGTLSSLEYARTITDTLAMLITQPVGMALLYSGVGKNHRSSMSAVAGTVLSITLPICVFLIAFAPDVVRMVFARGAFDAVAVSLTGDAMRGICVGLWAGTLGMILLRHLNNDGRNRTAALLLLSSFAGAMAFNIMCSMTMITFSHPALLLGCAESLRGIVVLSGVAYLLACHRQILRMLGLAAGPVLAMIAICAMTVQCCGSALERLIFGGASCIAAMLAIAYLLLPTHISALLARRAAAS
jgi:putative peptidoglycan lipid II flippase